MAINTEFDLLLRYLWKIKFWNIWRKRRLKNVAVVVCTFRRTDSHLLLIWKLQKVRYQSLFSFCFWDFTKMWSKSKLETEIYNTSCSKINFEISQPSISVLSIVETNSKTWCEHYRNRDETTSFTHSSISRLQFL